MTSAQNLSKALGGRWYGHYGTAPCPRCQTEGRNGQNALTLANGRDGRLLAHCKKAGCSFADILAAAGAGPGDYRQPDPEELVRREAERQTEARRRAFAASSCWRQVRPIEGTPAERYLRRRGIVCPLPPTLRFHPECWHGPTATRHPALVALVTGGDGFAVHRTYLRENGLDKATISPAKAMLGAVAGGAVRLAEGQGPLVVAEGIETALSLASGLLDRPARVWAALSTSGLTNLRLPGGFPDELIVATDGDKPGRSAGHDLAAKAAALGWQVSLLPAPDGADWNDVLQQMKGASDEHAC